MDFLLTRRWRSPLSWIGEVSILNDPFHCYSLEPSTPIPVMRYELDLTVSQRSKDGKLWSPREDHVLPLLLHVTGHEGIRIHALNTPLETEGCIGVGYSKGVDRIDMSRKALTDVMAKLEAAAAAAERSFLTIVETKE